MLQDSTHLSVLIERVHAEEAQFNYASKELLISVAEFILSWSQKYSKAEYDEAIRILATYHLAPLASRKVGWKLVEKELSRPYTARCRRCGRPITSEVSLASGFGCVRRKKVKISEAEQHSTEVNCPPLAINATPNHSLLSAAKTSLISNAVKTVANNIIKPAEVDHVENPLNCTIERMRRGGIRKNGL